MSARKPLARMDSPAVTETTEEIKEESVVSKTEFSINSAKTDEIAVDKNEKKDQMENKEENEKSGEKDQQLETQSHELSNSPSGVDGKKSARNIPLSITSPVKKKKNDTQEQYSSAELTSTADETIKKVYKPSPGRPRKNLDPNAAKPSSSSAPQTNRLTRKAAANDWAANTRLTRARRASVGIASRPETPPKRKYVFKKNIEAPAVAVKRKRSVSPKSIADEPDSKIIKTDDQNQDFEMNIVTVKQEMLESSEEMASDVASDITETSVAESSSRISLRARKSAMSYSPTTRPYRRDKDKLNTDSTPDGKRKRLMKERPDEDSKDSMTSSNMEDMAEVKVEDKFHSDDMERTNSDTKADGTADATESIIDEHIETISVPLTVVTTQPKSESPSTSTSAIATSDKSDSPKAASLSPELVSEGVSEISVKRFYKKPQFLENNLGIENDPKLGEIVQNVTDRMDEAVDGTSLSNESIKEGELMLDEEDDDIPSIGSIKNTNADDDMNSVSTGFISPLRVDDDEDDDKDDIALNGNEPDADISDDVELQISSIDDDEENVESVKIEITKDVPSGNVSVTENAKSDIVSESCDEAVAGDIEKKDILTSKQEVKDIKAHPSEGQNSVNERDKQLLKIIEKMEYYESNSEQDDTNGLKLEENVNDQEENKENVEVVGDHEKDITDELPKNQEEEPVASLSADDREESYSESSKTLSPVKTKAESSEESTTPSTSPQSSKSSSVVRTPENDERLRQKERHLKTLGLLTHKAADEAIMAKQKRRKFLHNLSNNSAKKNTGSTAGNAQNKSEEYTGTLKTVIKLIRQSGGGGSAGNGNGNGNGNGGGNGTGTGALANEPKKGKSIEGSNKAAPSGCTSRRQPLKMTFQKGRGRPPNTEKNGEHPANISGEDSYYTIQNENEGAVATTATTTENTSTVVSTTGHGRKSYNRSNTCDATHVTEHHETLSTNKKDEKEEILIPEKASSFKFHPGRLCQDQCYYCSGKFGLYDTPCHVAQIKSAERQQKILANEEKLTVDNCLCDACFRHVDRRANAPTYKKRASVPGRIETVTTNASPEDSANEQEKSQQSHTNGTASSSLQKCAVPECENKAAHSLRRKGIRKSIKKSLLNFDMSSAGTYLHICEKHYEAVVQSSGCVLCKRRLGKNSMYHITTDTDRLEKALADMGIPVTLGQGTAVCKLCRYFANLLMKPPEHGKAQKVEFVKNYKKRLLQFHNIHEKKDSSDKEDEEENETEKEKTSSKKQNAPATTKRLIHKSNTSEKAKTESKEERGCPPSPTHSTGSSVEVISDGDGVSNAEIAQQSSSTPTAVDKNSSSNQMVLDNDVMVDYDVPMISDSSSSASSESSSPSPQRMKPKKDQQSKLKAILQSVGTSLEDRNNISTMLRSNPNISMRELLPGEEDLGLQFKAPFGSSTSQRTPEGWTRVNTFLQYDEPTRRLWEDLQKPYGNQSSFLRHLILLEKYYRNGDLVLSSSASSNATVYARTVRNRLTSYDSPSSSSSSPSKELEPRSRSLSVDKIQRQLSSNSVTITARPKETKPHQKDIEREVIKQKDTNNSAGGVGSTATTSTPNSRSILKTNLIGMKGSAVELVPLSTSNSKSNSPHSSSGSTTPNDNSALTKQQKILAAANKLMNNKLEASPNQKKNVLNTTPPELISLNRRPAVTLNTQQTKRPQLLPKPMNSGKPIPPNVIVLPDTLTSQERLESKSWRPTLLPVTTSSHHLNNQQGPLYQTADGRRLPGLVQVQSGGRPFLISIHDYNRMCILRREKLMRDQMLKGSKGKMKAAIYPPATCAPTNNGKQTIISGLPSFNKTMQGLSVSSDNIAKKQRQTAGKIGIYTPIAPKPTPSSTATSSPSTACISQQQQQQSQSQPAVIIPAGTLQSVNLLPTNQTSSLSMLPNFAGQMVPLLNTNTTTSSMTAVSGVPTSSWLWNNFPDSNQMLLNGKSTTTTTATVTKGPQATFVSAKQQSLLLDNNLMSKIPKSLTVIPQHKLMPAPPSGGMVGNISKE